METPVLFLVFNRPDLTQQVLAAIRLAKPAKLFVAADGPRAHKENEAELCSQTRKTVLDNIDWDCEVHTLLRDENLGCKVAVSSAITWFFENVEAGIILEDDILPDQSFFKYCEEMLIRYKDDERVSEICGFNYMGHSLEVRDSYLFSRIGAIWGWATWRRAWAYYDVEIKTWKNNNTKRQILDFLGNKDWFNTWKPIFDLVYNKLYDTWDYQWVYAQLYSRGMAIIPHENLIENLGFREDATHTVGTNNLIESLKKSELLFPLNHPIKVVNNYSYENYSFSLLPRPHVNYLKKVIVKFKTKLKWALGK